jgi:3,4-dihydroxy 2-butanone 4-phosphate synthase / GTP cyclohydrolase II
MFNTIEESIEELKKGKMIIVVDDEDRENEGDLTIASEKVTPEAINFMAKYGRGLICISLTAERVEELGLPMMVNNNRAPFQTAFTVSIESRLGVSTGISAKDRSQTVLTAIDPQTKPSDLVSPGHMFPLKAQPGGVLKRAGQTEAAVDLTRLAGLYPSGVICEVMKDDGTMARVPDLIEFCKIHDMKMITIKDLISYRMKSEKFVKRIAEIEMPTAFGHFKAIAYSNILDSQTHIALVKGNVSGKEGVLVRVHSQCLTGEVFGSFRCDCGAQLINAMEMIEKSGLGVLLYLSQEGRGIGLANKLKAYQLQDNGKDTVEANVELGFKDDQRDYGLGAQILADLGLNKIRVLTNNPRKYIGLKGYGLEIIERIPLEIIPNEDNMSYLKTKKDKLGHMLTKV